MKTNEIEKLLREMKDDPDFGALDNSSSARLEARVFSFVDREIAEQPMAPSGAFDFVKSLPGVFTDMVAKPMALTSLLMVLVLGGWITSVNASLDTLPGDAFYNVKLVSEKAQLVLASSNTKPKLHAEFASRRLNEIATLVQADGDDADKQNVQTAIDGFKKQMDGVNSRLQSSEDSDVVVELARILEQKAEGLEVVLELAEDDADSHGAITEAILSAEDVKVEVVERLVQRAENSDSSRTELERQFKNELKSIASQTTTITARLARVENALIDREDVVADLSSIKIMLLTQDLSESMDYAASGGYERAFEGTKQVKQALRSATDQLIEIEIQLTQPREEVVSDSGLEGVILEGDEAEVSGNELNEEVSSPPAEDTVRNDEPEVADADQDEVEPITDTE